MLRYKTESRPGLVALYDIRPGNGVGQFLQPQSPHKASLTGSNIRKNRQAVGKGTRENRLAVSTKNWIIFWCWKQNYKYLIKCMHT